MELRVEGLACRRGEAVVLRDVGFVLAPGEALILRGPNGAGKTTMLRALAGLTPPVAGTISAPQEAMAYGAHADGLKAQLTVAENLTFWAAAFGTSGIGPAVAAFDLGALLDRRTADLSAGQKRRASLARMVLTGRPIWLLDEPTVSLDAANVARFAAAVSTHLEAGGSALIATHIDLGLAETRVLDVTQFAARAAARREADPFAEAIE
ncbi:cytochrome c biogenesis ATP-binding export protein CcmA [Jannaschia pagri]|uniref:Cytochrome c biogenesis ATP-binding export protein CcmA n=1 Tax=Jannaschia pagri TaxID=2829797 RepID=A0ABQ4NG10_9RHOB|nr:MULTISPECIES: heme ABC exporter ATP-binding protein CcmA [unclassified Jannaschia]GIT90509.1 cytochrome c biogenesis ATP-binding export protein CcmA [Jannaschia sp. AI_61]GIT93386.1 cytochrome c biogenesis ATP-binding export protein CcmA [Jannaschia sp. AI_62]